MPAALPISDVMVARNERGFIHAISPSISPAFDDRFLTTMTRQGCTVQVFTQAEYVAVFLPGDPGDVEEPADVDEPALAPNHAKVSVPDWRGLPLTTGAVEALLADWASGAQHLAVAVDARRGLAAALLLGRPLTGNAYRLALLHLDARLQRREVTAEQADAQRAALRGPEAFRISGPWGGTVHLPNPAFQPPEAPALPAIGEVFEHPLLGRSRGEYWIGTGEARQLVAVGQRGSGIVHPGQWTPLPDKAPAAAAPENSTKSQHHPPPRTAPASSMPSLFD